jgi:hypothetical protein
MTCFDEPKKKYKRTGKNEVYKPYTGGRLLRKPYAIPEEEKTIYRLTQLIKCLSGRIVIRFIVESGVKHHKPKPNHDVEN